MIARPRSGIESGRSAYGRRQFRFVENLRELSGERANMRIARPIERNSLNGPYDVEKTRVSSLFGPDYENVETHIRQHREDKADSGDHADYTERFWRQNPGDHKVVDDRGARWSQRALRQARSPNFPRPRGAGLWASLAYRPRAHALRRTAATGARPSARSIQAQP